MKDKGLVSGVFWLTKPVGDADINLKLRNIKGI
jgi:hypothetical protein